MVLNSCPVKDNSTHPEKCLSPIAMDKMVGRKSTSRKRHVGLSQTDIKVISQSNVVSKTVIDDMLLLLVSFSLRLTQLVQPRLSDAPPLDDARWKDGYSELDLVTED